MLPWKQPSQGSEAIVQITEILGESGAPQININAINVGFVTSLILVLFVIGIVIALAKVETQAPTAHTERMPESPLYLTVTTDLTLWLGNEAIGRNILPTALDSATKGERDTRVFLRADNSVSYGEVMEVMNLLCKAGYRKVALVELGETPVQINLALSPDKCQVTTDITLWLGNDRPLQTLNP